MQGQFINYNNSSFHYRVFGNGPKILFCFHGYGRDSYTFGFLAKYLGKRYTLIAVDAPHHGNTKWDSKVFRPKDLVTILQKIRTAIGKEAGKISLLGFSMGGRIALHLTQVLPAQIERVVLLAPDGLKFNFWTWFSTNTWVGHKLFEYTIYHPKWLLRSMNFAERYRFLSKSIVNFVRYYLDDHEERMVLYRRYIIMRKFNPHLSSIKRTINKNQIQVRMLFGSLDRIIHSASGERFLKKIDKYATIQIIDAGHDLLRDYHAHTISELFND
ncbi:MAG TPA: alpha/beta hydrolase [Segetibacter sp.]|jgi:pimeloyl-ACP methyl ester carboxylesterase